MSVTTHEEKLYEALLERLQLAIANRRRKGERVSPAGVATDVMAGISFDTPPRHAVRLAAGNYLSAIARGLLGEEDDVDGYIEWFREEAKVEQARLLLAEEASRVLARALKIEWPR
jgi:hypothetical protein